MEIKTKFIRVCFWCGEEHEKPLNPCDKKDEMKDLLLTTGMKMNDVLDVIENLNSVDMNNYEKEHPITNEPIFSRIAFSDLTEFEGYTFISLSEMFIGITIGKRTLYIEDLFNRDQINWVSISDIFDKLPSILQTQIIDYFKDDLS